MATGSGKQPSLRTALGAPPMGMARRRTRRKKKESPHNTEQHMRNERSSRTWLCTGPDMARVASPRGTPLPSKRHDALMPLDPLKPHSERTSSTNAGTFSVWVTSCWPSRVCTMNTFLRSRGCDVFLGPAKEETWERGNGAQGTPVRQMCGDHQRSPGVESDQALLSWALDRRICRCCVPLQVMCSPLGHQ